MVGNKARGMRRHPFRGRAVAEMCYDEVAFLRRVRRDRKHPRGRAWRAWFTNRVLIKRYRIQKGIQS